MKIIRTKADFHCTVTFNHSMVKRVTMDYRRSRMGDKGEKRWWGRKLE